MTRRLLSLVSLLVCLTSAWAATTLQLAVGTVTTALNTEMNSIGSNGWTAASATIDNRIGQTLQGSLLCRVEALVTYAASPTAGGAITGWFLKTVDTTNFENTPTATIGLNRLPDFVIPATTGQTGTRASVDVRCPAERFKVVVQNTASGQSWNGGGVNFLKILPITLQGNP